MAKKQKEKKELTKLQALKKKTLKEKWIMLSIKWALLLAPIIALVIYRREQYFTYKDGLSVSIGCILVAVGVFLLVKKQSKWLKGVAGYAYVFAICYFLQTILQDAIYISGALLVGQLLSFWFDNPIEKRRAILKKINEAEVNNVALSEVVIKTTSV